MYVESTDEQGEKSSVEAAVATAAAASTDERLAHRGPFQRLLGQPEIAALGLIQMVKAIRVEEKYPKLHQSLGSLPDEFEIKLKEGATPFALPVPRRLPLGLREATRRELERMAELDVIEKVEDWMGQVLEQIRNSSDQCRLYG